MNEVFFCQRNSFYAVWEDAGKYTAALRIEPYSDGYLLCALETAPRLRRRGYATLLMRQVIAYLSSLGDGIIYSHVSKRNTTSLSVHKNCGFVVSADYAVYSDGSVQSNSYTLKLVYKKSEST